MASSCSLLSFIISIIIIIVIVSPLSIKAQKSSYRNVTLRSFIDANDDDDAGSSTWTSPSGEFAFGFRRVAPGAFLLAIWFDQIPDKTIVWSANRDDPVPAGSRVQLLADGALELIDQRRRRIWGARQDPSGTVAYAVMLDTGNFVLAANTSAILWQSFDEPTDTLLPSQVLNAGRNLISSFSATNYSEGKFILTLQTDGNLLLNPRTFTSKDDAYWSSETLEGGLRLIFNYSGIINFVRRNGSVHQPLFNNGALVGQFRQRLTLEYDGVLRHYVYPAKSPNPSSMASAWDARHFVPDNICVEMREKNTGGGPCGFNSICSMGTDGRPSCSCPPSYSSKGGLSGCVPDFEQHRCDQEALDAQHFTFQVIHKADWPDSDYANIWTAGEDWCRQSCIEDCYCAAAVIAYGACFKKSLPFSNGRIDSGFDGKTLIKVRNNTMSNSPDIFASSTSKSSSSATLIITLSVLLGSCLVLLLLLSSVFFLFRRKWKKMKIAPAAGVHPAGVTTMRRFSFKELQEATKGFKEELGRGACSIVYKGALKENGNIVAVKRLHKIAKEADLEFTAEASSISRTNHKNLVQLLGYCDQGQNRILVYEFMTNGSLASFLFEKSPKPNWYTRVQITFAIARGLCYLHEECSLPIIHCDIKPQNVLLDDSYTPKIADFGLARLLKPDQTKTMTGIRGTRGYVVPEWFRNMPITVKVDVYSFGILLLELLCCRRNYDEDLEEEGEMVLADWAYDCYQQGALDLLMAGDEEARSDMKLFEIFVKTAIWCIQEDPTLRPHMRRVMHMLEGSIQVPAPPDPTTFIA